MQLIERRSTTSYSVENRLWTALWNCRKQWRTEEGGVKTPPPPEIPKALQNRAKLNPIVKIVKNC